MESVKLIGKFLISSVVPRSFGRVAGRTLANVVNVAFIGGLTFHVVSTRGCTTVAHAAATTGVPVPAAMWWEHALANPIVLTLLTLGFFTAYRHSQRVTAFTVRMLAEGIADARAANDEVAASFDELLRVLRDPLPPRAKRSRGAARRRRVAAVQLLRYRTRGSRGLRPAFVSYCGHR